jgi:hypothetical protein
MLHANRQVYNVLKGSILTCELLYNKIHIIGKYVTGRRDAVSYPPMTPVFCLPLRLSNQSCPILLLVDRGGNPMARILVVDDDPDILLAT